MKYTILSKTAAHSPSFTHSLDDSFIKVNSSVQNKYLKDLSKINVLQLPKFAPSPSTVATTKNLKNGN